MATAGARSPLLFPEGGVALVLSALLFVLAYPPFDLVVPPLVALAPLAVWVEATPSGRAALRGGLWYGLLLWFLLLLWLPVTLFRFLPGALPGWPLVVAALAAVVASVVWAAHRLRHGVGAPLWLAVPLAWTAGEWLRARLPGSLAFPWLDLGTSLAGHPEWVGIAEVVGGRGVGFVLALAGGLVGSAWVAWRRDRRPGRPAALVLTAATVLLLPAAWGVHRARTLVTRPSLTVAVLQTAVPQEAKADPWRAAEEGMAAVERLLPAVGEGRRVDVAILPEAVLPVRLEGPEAARLRRRLERAVARAGVPVLVGALGLERAGPGEEDDVAYNSVFLVRPEGGLTPPRYDKRHLVPVVERVPLPGWAGGGDGGAWGSYGFGRSAAPLRVGGAGGGADLGPLICLESAFPRAARALRRAGADVLVNLTNDAWLNAPSPSGRTPALAQHPAHLVMRAIETRAGAARAANTGISLFVDPTGQTGGELPVFREGVSVATLRTTDGPTPFVRLGDLAGAGAFGATLLLLLLPLVPLPGRSVDEDGNRPGRRHPRRLPG